MWSMFVEVSVLLLSDLAPGNDEIHEEEQEVFLTPGNPQEGQVILYKVFTAVHVFNCFEKQWELQKFHYCGVFFNLHLNNCVN